MSKNTSLGSGDYPTSIRGQKVSGGDDEFYVQKLHPSAEERDYEADESRLKKPHEISYG